jgi:uncharacterized membrane protein YdfJ with MMPL/SSD domain
MKKGELTIEYIIVLMLALIILVTLAIVFRSQIATFITKITSISDTAINLDLLNTNVE